MITNFISILLFYFICLSFTIKMAASDNWNNILCKFPGVSVHSSVKSNGDSVAYYECQVGYNLIGQAERHCNLDTKTWNGSVPVCAVDVAMRMPVFLSTYTTNFTAQLATDGISGGSQNDSTCTETEFEQSPWIIIDLLSYQNVYAFNISFILEHDQNNTTTGRVDLELRVGNSSTVFNQNQKCSQVSPVRGNTILQAACQHVIYGRYVFLRASSSSQLLHLKLSLCKIQLFSQDVLSSRHCPFENQWLFNDNCYSIALPFTTIENDNESISSNNAVLMDWFESSEYCSQSQGILLDQVTPELQDMLAWQIALVNDQSPASLWIGVMQKSADSDWRTLSGALSSSSYWSPSLGVDSINSSSVFNYSSSAWPLCAAVETSNPAFWIHQPCNKKTGWICKYNISYCGAPAYPEKAVDFHPRKTNDFDRGQTSEYSCDEGTWLSRKCGINGKWDGNVSAKCPEKKERVLCTIEKWNKLKNGYVEVDMVNETQVLLYSCNDGYILNGMDTRICWNNGTWEGQPPICKEMVCPSPQPIQFGVVSLHNHRNMVGAKVSYVCDPGYALQGKAMLICLSSGHWSAQWPVCKEVPTKKPHVLPKLCPEFHIDNGDIIYVDEGRHPSNRVLIKCAPGFHLTSSDNFMLVCQNTASWNTSLIPTCAPVKSFEEGLLVNAPKSVTSPYDFGLHESNENNNTDRKDESSWIILIIGLVGVALLIVIVGFGIALLLTKRQKSRACSDESCIGNHANSAIGLRIIDAGTMGNVQGHPMSFIYPNTNPSPYFHQSTEDRPTLIVAKPPIPPRQLPPIPDQQQTYQDHTWRSSSNQTLTDSSRTHLIQANKSQSGSPVLKLSSAQCSVNRSRASSTRSRISTRTKKTRKAPRRTLSHKSSIHVPRQSTVFASGKEDGVVMTSPVEYGRPAPLNINGLQEYCTSSSTDAPMDTSSSSSNQHSPHVLPRSPMISSHPPSAVCCSMGRPSSVTSENSSQPPPPIAPRSSANLIHPPPPDIPPRSCTNTPISMPSNSRPPLGNPRPYYGTPHSPSGTPRPPSGTPRPPSGTPRPSRMIFSTESTSTHSSESESYEVDLTPIGSTDNRTVLPEPRVPLPPPVPPIHQNNNNNNMQQQRKPGVQDLQREILTSPLFMKLKQAHGSPGEPRYVDPEQKLPDDPSPPTARLPSPPVPPKPRPRRTNSRNGDLLTPSVYKVSALSTSARPPETQVHKKHQPPPPRLHSPPPVLQMESQAQPHNNHQLIPNRPASYERDAILRLESLRRHRRENDRARQKAVEENFYADSEDDDIIDDPIGVLYASSPSIPRPALRSNKYTDKEDYGNNTQPPYNRRVEMQDSGYSVPSPIQYPQYHHSSNITVNGNPPKSEYEQYHNNQTGSMTARIKYPPDWMNGDVSVSSETESDRSHEEEEITTTSNRPDDHMHRRKGVLKAMDKVNGMVHDYELEHQDVKPRRRVHFDTTKLVNGHISLSDSEGNENIRNKHSDGRHGKQSLRGSLKNASEEQVLRWANEANVLLDDRALQMILEGDTFQLDHSFLEPVQLSSHIRPHAHRHQQHRQIRSHAQNNEHSFSDGTGSSIGSRRPKPAPRVSLLGPHPIRSDLAQSNHFPSTIKSGRSGGGDQKLKPRHQKRVQFRQNNTLDESPQTNRSILVNERN